MSPWSARYSHARVTPLTSKFRLREPEETAPTTQATQPAPAPANPGTAQLLTADEKKTLHLDNPDEYMKRIYFWQDVPRRTKYTEIWNEVKNAQ